MDLLIRMGQERKVKQVFQYRSEGTEFQAGVWSGVARQGRMLWPGERCSTPRGVLSVTSRVSYSHVMFQ